MSQGSRLPVNTGMDPRMLRIGRDGREFYRGLLELHALHGQDGLLSTPWDCIEQIVLALPSFELGDIAEAALQACCEAELIEVGNGGIRLLDWPWDRTPIPARVRRHVLRRDGDLCSYCGAACEPGLDHVEPVARGGGHEPENLVAACQACNSSKCDTPLLLWLAQRRAS